MRVIRIIPTLFAISIISFILINLPPGDWLTTEIQRLQAAGNPGARQQMEHLKEHYGLDKPIYIQYLKWILGFVRGDFGESFSYKRPVNELIWERLGLTVLISVSSLIFTWLVGIPIGVYAAVRQYSIGDHFFTFLSFIGLAVPNFLLALFFITISFFSFGQSVGGLFSPAYAYAPWSLMKVVDMFKHLWVPLIVVGTAGTAMTMRIMRGNLLDILSQQYVTTARAKGLPELIVIWKHAVRNALHPLIMNLGMSLPYIISGATLTSIVLSLPTTGPLYFKALQQQDMYLAGTFLMMLAIMLVIGNLIADILLAWLDPRIRYN